MVSEEPNSDIELASEVIPVPQVQPQVEAPEVVNTEDVKTNASTHKKLRLRNRALHAAILKQMEFYFSDSNLTKDRFLAGLVKQNPDVDIEVFTTFNRIRTLTTKVSRIAKALRNSTILQVSEDGKKVRRITPIVEKENIDECTVYVQRLPSDADHEWLSNRFSKYGPVAYVSIPKFKFNHKIKGFGFVEFETPAAAQKCLKAFQAKNCVLPSHTSPTDVLSITTFNEEEKQQQNGLENSEKTCEKNDNIIGENNEKIDEKVVEGEKRKSRKKRKKSLKPDDTGNSENYQLDVPKIKRKKGNDNHEKDSSTCVSDSNTEVEEKKTKKRKYKVSLEGVHSDAESQKNLQEGSKKQKNDNIEKDPSTCASDSNVEEKKGKKRKHRVSVDGVNLNTESYENFQEDRKKKKMKVEESESECSTKNEITKIEKDEETVESANDEENSEKKKRKKRKRKSHTYYEVLDTLDFGLHVMSKKDWKSLRNKYLQLQRAKMKQLKQHMRNARWNQWNDRTKLESDHQETTNIKKENSSSHLEFVPGVIVKVELGEPCVDPKNFKTLLKSNNNIKYIDVKEGSTEAFIRCDSSDAAKTLTEKTDELQRYSVLTGDDEKSYWDKISRDREEKIGNKMRPKQRGRAKLLKKAEKELGKHIKFDEV